MQIAKPKTLAIVTTLIFMISGLAILLFSAEISSSRILSIIVLFSAFSTMIAAPVFTTIALREFVEKKTK